MSKLVVLVGSGATRAQAPHGCPESAIPPLDRHFFSQAHRVSPSDPRLRSVESYIRRHYGYSTTHRTIDSFEAVASILYSDSYSPRTGTVAYPVLLSLVQFLSARIAATVNQLRPSMSNCLEQLMNYVIVKDDPENIAVVTFNYDIQIERALRDLEDLLTPGGDRIFSFPGCYRLRQNDVREFINSRTLLPEADINEKSSGIPILKLHGSLNWYSGYRSITPSQRQFLSPAKTRKIRIGNIENIPNWPIWVSTQNSRRLRGYPMLVPPVPHKSGLFHEEINRLWSIAFDELSSADEIVVFGYSCPQSDQEAANLIRSAAGLNDSLSHVTIIDPDPRVINRFVDLTGAKSISWHKNVDEFLQRSP